MDPVLVLGRQARERAIQGLKETPLATLKVRVPAWDKALPRRLFSQPGSLLHQIREWAEVVGKVAYLRNVDKY